MTDRILILGGTREAAEIAQRLHDEGHIVTTSLAGRTKEPQPIKGAVRIGGFGGAEGLANYLVQNAIDRLIDATHPFANQITENAKRASMIANVPLERYKRKPWKQQTDDIWHPVSDIPAAIAALPKGARVLLALGSQHIGPFASRDDVHFTIRMVDPPIEQLPFKHHSLILSRPSADPTEEQSLLTEHSITHIVCRNSGGPGAYAKIEAARNLRLPVIMIERAEARRDAL